MSNLAGEREGESNLEKEDLESAKPGLVRRTIWRGALVGAVALAVVVIGLASRYQPLTLAPSWSTSGPLSPSGIVSVSLETNLANAGFFGVSVQRLDPTVYAQPPVVVAPLRPCFKFYKGTRQCSFDAKGYSVGDRFHPFALNGGSVMPVVWRNSYSCRPNSTGSSISGPVEVRVTYRFLLFTHTALLMLDNVSTSGGPGCNNSG